MLLRWTTTFNFITWTRIETYHNWSTRRFEDRISNPLEQRSWMRYCRLKFWNWESFKIRNRISNRIESYLISPDRSLFSTSFSSGLPNTFTTGQRKSCSAFGFNSLHLWTYFLNWLEMTSNSSFWMFHSKICRDASSYWLDNLKFFLELYKLSNYTYRFLLWFYWHLWLLLSSIRSLINLWKLNNNVLLLISSNLHWRKFQFKHINFTLMVVNIRRKFFLIKFNCFN